MKEWLLELLVSPDDGGPLTVEVTGRKGLDIESGRLIDGSGHEYSIIGGIPRFVSHHYAKGFGIQWTRHRATQIDTARHGHSAKRFWEETGFDPAHLAGALVLDGGCGAGRFARVAVDAGARVVAVDISEAVDGAITNFDPSDNVSFIQADLFHLPLKRGSFDYIYTIGVIQHTPDPLKALSSLLQLADEVAGQAAVSWYKRYWYTYLHQKYFLRPLLCRLPEETLYRFVAWYVPKLLPLSRRLVQLIPALGRRSLIDRILPVAYRDAVGDLTPEQEIDWAVLDTFDWYSPKYDNPQRWTDVEEAFHRERFATRRLGRVAIAGKRCPPPAP